MSERPEPSGPPGPDDAAWREIVENFGERASLPDDPTEPPNAEPPSARPSPDPGDERAADWDPDEHYIPPPPPPAPRPTGPRGLAWLGLFGAPVVLLVCMLVRVSLPSWVNLLLFLAFIGGFGYLVATMRKHDDSDPGDDGAVV